MSSFRSPLRLYLPFLLLCTSLALSTSNAETRLDEDLDTYILEIMRSAGIPGLSATVVRDGTLLWSGAYGDKRVHREVPVDAATVFNLASISKTMIVTAVMQLAEAGLLDLDDDINLVLPFEVRNPHSPTDEVITLRMLLAHVAGIRDNWNVMSSLYTRGDSPIPLGVFLEEYLTVEGAYYSAELNYTETGAEGAFRYSNIGASLAAYLVELASGLPFHEYCRQRIFEPLGMASTSYLLADFQRAEVAMPYEYSERRDKYTPKGFYGYPDYPDGGLRASAQDLSRFQRAFVSGGELDGIRILSQASVTEVMRVQYPELNANQGLIWYYREKGELIGHDGDDRGVHTRMSLSPATGVGVILLANINRSRSVTQAFTELEARLYDEANGWHSSKDSSTRR